MANSSWRNLVIDGASYKWRTTSTLVVRDEHNKKILCKPAWQVKGYGNPCDYENDVRYSGSSKVGITPKDVRREIDSLRQQNPPNK